MKVLQIQRGCESCCLVLVFGLSSSPVLPPVRAVLDYVRTTAPALLPADPAAQPIPSTGPRNRSSPLIRSVDPRPFGRSVDPRPFGRRDTSLECPRLRRARSQRVHLADSV